MMSTRHVVTLHPFFIHVLLLLRGTTSDVAKPEEYVNVLGGTKSRFDFSHGNILPETQVPWGFNGWAPETDPDQGDFWFYSESARMFGIRCTHQPSPWIGDYGNMRFMAHIADNGHQGNNQFSAYKASQSIWLPHYQKHTMLGYGNRNGYLSIELAPTEHGAIMRFKFPPFDGGALAAGHNQTRRIAVSLNSINDTIVVSPPGADGLIVMQGTTILSPERGKNGSHHFYMTVAGGADERNPAVPFATNATGGFGFLDFEPVAVAGDTLTLRVATSMISLEQAQANHDAEVKGKTFDWISRAAKALWHDLLARVDILDLGPGYTKDQEKDVLTAFYSSMYRAAKYPRKLFELNHETGQPIHWSPYTGQIEQGVLSADQGFWDAYRTIYSWLALVAPERMAEMMEGWANAYLEGGWLPQWSKPGYGGGMTGTMSDVSLSEAIIKLPHCGSSEATAKGYCVNASVLYLASRKNAFVDPGNSSNGRACLKEYLEFGYIPFNCSDADVSRSMNYWHSDYAIGNAALFLGKDALKMMDPAFEDDATVLIERSKNWVKLLDPQTGFFRQKDKAGNFIPGFDEFAWGPGPGYTEAGPWQYRVEVPYDPQGLNTALRAMGFDGCDIIQQANTIPGIFHFGGYGSEIHEMSEMAMNCWSQWELNNQPVWALQHMQIGFDTSPTGKCANQAQKWLRQSNSMLKAGTDMYPGDEDNGSMGAWFIMNMLGIYPLSPASGNYVLGSPMFAKTTIKVPGASTPITIIATNQSPENVYVLGVTWNGKPLDGIELKYSDLVVGGTLEFTMGSAPASVKIVV
mmetsp:Transcript_115375/g.230032  ORF Transcript_115375/g.230032 Transcript_115375/m.230032 type:complete len:804 (-) Transcript_115375:257-2668(-)